MKDYIVVIEIPKLSISYPLKIQGITEVFYLYSKSLLRELTGINQKLKTIKNRSELSYYLNSFLSKKDFDSEISIHKKNNESSYIISNIELDTNFDAGGMLVYIRKRFNLLVSLLSLLLREKFSISKIFLFEKRTNHVYKFVRMVEVSLINAKILEEETMLIKPIDIGIEIVFPYLLKLLKNKEDFISYINKYLYTLEKTQFNDKFRESWFFLERLARSYLSNLVFRNELRVKVDKLPATKAIRLMFEKINMVYEGEIFNVLREQRNRSIHQEEDLKEIYEKFDFFALNITFEKLIIYVKKFFQLIEEVLLSFFGFVPFYLREVASGNKLDLDWNYTWIEPKLRIDPLKGDIITQCKTHLLKDMKYISILKFIERFKARINHLLSNNYIDGVIRDGKKHAPAQIRLRQYSKGKVKMNYKLRDNIPDLTKQEILFTSLYNNYILNLEFSIGNVGQCYWDYPQIKVDGEIFWSLKEIRSKNSKI